MRTAIVLIFSLILLQGCFPKIGKTMDKFFYSNVTEIEMIKFALSHKKFSDYETMKSIHSWMISNMTWEQDSWGGFLDYPRDSKRTLKRKRGDCEDFAGLAMEVLKRNNIESFYFAVLEDSENLIKKGHVVCLVKLNNSYYHIGNYKKLYGPYNNYKSVASSIFPKWKTYEVKDYDFKTINK